MKRKQNCILRRIGGRELILPIEGEMIQTDAIFILEGIGTFLWEQLASECTRQTLLKAVLSEYDVDKETAGEDLDEFIKNAKDVGIIEN